MSGRPELSVVILSWNTRDLLRECLQSVVGQDHGMSLEVIVVDNASEDDSARLVRDEFPEVALVANTRNTGYAGGNNQGIQLAQAPLVLLLNSDTEVPAGAFVKLVGFLEEHPSHGAVAPRLVHADGRVQTSCMRFPDLKVGFLYDSWWERRFGRPACVSRYFMEDFDHLSSRDVDQPPGACFLLRRAVLDQVGGFDERLFLFFNDVDLCQRITEAGWKIHYLAEATVVHHEGRSTSQYPQFVQEWNVNRARYYRKHHGWFGSLVVKTALVLRAAEEAVKALAGRSGPRGPVLRQIGRVLGTALRA